MTKFLRAAVRVAAPLTGLLLGASCQRWDLGGLDVYGMFASSGTHTEDRVAEWLEWDESHGPNVIDNVPDDYRVYVCSDTHIDSSAARAGEMMRRETADPRGLFSVILGDLAGAQGERPYRLLDSAMRGKDTCFVVIGNHDIYFDCQTHFQRLFHTSTYCVTVRTRGGAQDLWVFLDSGNATHGRRQGDWLRRLLADRDKYRHLVVCTHTSLFRNSYDYSTTPAANLPEDECYELMELMSRSRADLFLMGHFHHKEQHCIGGVQYVMTDNLNETDTRPSYLVVDCGQEVSYQYCDL